MSRTRMYRPEFWTSDQVVDCSRDARLTFLGLLNFCDDNGIHPASARRLRIKIFPSDLINDGQVTTWVNELLTVGLLALYDADETLYLVVTGWNRHQKIDKPTYRHPLPTGSVGIKFSDELRRAFDESSPSPRRLLAEPSTRKERKGGEREFPSQEIDGQPTECVHAGGASKFPRRKFLAVGGRHA
jgi:hypothetical protein